MMRPWLGRRLPAMIENRVVLPAPFGPMRAVIRPTSAEKDTRSSASKPPKRFDTCSTRSRGSTIVGFQRSARGGLGGQGPGRKKAIAKVREDAGYATRRDRNDQNENATVDDQIETGRIARRELAKLSKRLDDERAEQGTKHGSDAANDGRQQRLDRDP